ncbi:transcription antitermination factor NusB [Thermanaerovibrio velox DSM 12556]|uniref:Transcription antitermination protein NusB n=1 Tax=Thermanaerovibrio velox DSM 12556 TaxID=926567 RepID=H0URH1_9BACT|nr:transcription antitermination factor NusB [Thermanaerovibrio velox]EHM09910.1 transcription antitermination factor NusB [Thermanaerovibrio velox DSM 12556]
MSRDLPKKRRRAREIALQLGYLMDMRQELPMDKVLSSLPLEEEEPEVRDYATALVRGLFKERDILEGLLREHLVGWRPERMVSVDRVLIRLALLEGYVDRLVPYPVAISEAVELAKLFGTDESGRFVNGVLGRMFKDLSKESGEASSDEEV